MPSKDTPFAAILVTDIDSDMEDVEAQLGLISGLAQHSRTPVIASGVVRSAMIFRGWPIFPTFRVRLFARALFRKTLGSGRGA